MEAEVALVLRNRARALESGGVLAEVARGKMVNGPGLCVLAGVALLGGWVGSADGGAPNLRRPGPGVGEADRRVCPDGEALRPPAGVSVSDGP